MADAHTDDNKEEENGINESSPLKPIPEVDEKALKDETKKKLTLRERFKLIRENTTVEPIMIGYIMPSVLASLATQNLNLEKACRVNLNFTTEICDALNLRQTENYTQYEEEVQKLTASVQAWKNVIQTAIPVMLILFVGAWSDKTGRRKACILLPIVGEFITCLGFMVNTYYFYELPVEVAALTEAIFPAITGGWFTNFIGVFSYISDITTTENRTHRVGMVNLFMSLGYPVGSALSGVLLTSIGYYGVFSLSAVLYSFSLLYGYFYLDDPKRKVDEKSNEKSGTFGFVREFFDLKLVMETFKVAFKKGPGNRRLRVALLLIVVCVVFGPLHGEFSIMYLFTRYRFNWDEVKYSMWSTYCIVSNLIGTLFSISLFSNRLKLDDTILGIISNTSKIIAAFAYAFARNNLEIYLAPLLEILNGTSFIAMRSIATKLVSGEEFGKVNSLFGLAEAMMPLVYGPLYSRVYMATLNVLPGAVFLLGAVLTLPSIAIFMILSPGKVNSLFGLAEAMMPLVYGPLYSRVYMATLNVLPGAVFLLGAVLTLPSIAIFMILSPGKVNSLFGLAEAMMPLVYGPLYSRVYMATLNVLPGAVFLLGAVLTLPSIAIFMILSPGKVNSLFGLAEAMMPLVYGPLYSRVYMATLNVLPGAVFLLGAVLTLPSIAIFMILSPGKVNSLFGLAEAMMPLVYGPLYSRVYMATLNVLPGAVFLLGAVLTLPSIAIFMILSPGKVNSLFGLAEAMMPLVYGPLYSRVYMATLNVLPGAVFLLGAVLTLPSIAIFMILSPGKVNSLFGLAEAMMPLVYGPLYSRVYMATLNVLPGAVFLLGAVLTLPSIAIFMILSPGKVNSLFGLAEAMMPLVYGPLYSRVYMATLNVLPGAVFLLGAVLTLPSIAIFMILSPGKVNSLFGLAEAMMPLVYGPLYSRVYMATLNVLPGAVFLLGAVLTLPSIAIFMILSPGKVNSLFGLAEAMMPLVYGPLYSRVYMATLNVLPGAVFLLGAVLTLPSIAIFMILSPGKVNSLFGLAEAMMPLVYGPLYSRVYMATLNVLPGAVFLLGAVLTLPSIAIFGWLYFEHKKDKERERKETSDESPPIPMINISNKNLV